MDIVICVVIVLRMRGWLERGMYLLFTPIFDGILGGVAIIEHPFVFSSNDK